MDKRKRRIALVCALLLALLLGAAGYAARKTMQVYLHMRDKLNTIDENVAFSNEVLRSTFLPVKENHYEFDYSWLEAGSLVAHGLGGLEGMDRANCLEAMEAAYENGFRVFEGDLMILEDQLVLIHDEDRFCEMTGLEPGSYGFRDFQQAEIFGKYHTVDLDALLDFLAEHPDAYFITDSRYTSGPDSAYTLSLLARRALERDENVLDRVIVQIYNQQMLSQVMSIYPFRSVIYTLYLSHDTDTEAMRFCIESGVGAMATYAGRMTDTLATSLTAAGIHPLVYTVNEKEQVQRLFDVGVEAVYTDFLKPADLAGKG